jgi:anti-anti-sigma factor
LIHSTQTELRDGLLRVRRSAEGRRVRLSLDGELDLANARTAELALAEALDSGKEVLVDLRELEFLDSTGVALLVAAMRGQGGERLSFLPSDSLEVCRLLRLTGIDQWMRVGDPAAYGSLPAA